MVSTVPLIASTTGEFRRILSIIKATVTRPMKFYFFLFSCLLLLSTPSAHGNNLNNFDFVTKKITSRLFCQEASTFGNIFGCILGKKETVKIFVERHLRKPYQILRTQFIWEDYHRDVGIPIQSDASAAKKALSQLVKILRPQDGDFILSILSQGEGTRTKGHIQLNVEKGPTAFIRQVAFN
jgi:hypothetical protein